MGKAAWKVQVRPAEAPRQRPEDQPPSDLGLQERGIAAEAGPRRRLLQRVPFQLVEDEVLEEDQDQEAPVTDAQIQESSRRLWRYK